MNFCLSTLYVGELHPEVTESMLMDVFSLAGDVHSIWVCRDWNTGTSHGHAYVNFYLQPDAERALATLNTELLMGQPIRVSWCQRDSTVPMDGIGSLFIKNLDMETIDSMALYDLFSTFGKVLSCKVVAYKKGTKGYGCVQFDSQDMANLAKERLDGKLFNDHKVSIEHFKSLEERQAEANLRSQKEIVDLFVKNLDKSINVEGLRMEFSKFGTVTKAKIITDNGRSRGFGFVRFLSSEEAMRAKNELNGQMLGKKQVFVDVAHQREKRRRNMKMEDMENQDLTDSSTLSQNIELYTTTEAPYVKKEWTDVTTPPSTDTFPESDVDTVQDIDHVPSLPDTALPEDNERSAPVIKVQHTSPTDAAMARPPRKLLTIYMLESVEFEDQVQMAYDHLLPLVEEIHPSKADQITSMLVQSETKYEIINMIGDPDFLRAKVDQIGMLLRTVEAGVKQEILKMHFGTKKKKKENKKIK